MQPYAVNPHDPARWVELPTRDVQERRLAAAIAPEQSAYASRCNLQLDAVQNRRRVDAERHAIENQGPIDSAGHVAAATAMNTVAKRGTFGIRAECQHRDTKSAISRPEGGFYAKTCRVHGREKRRSPRRFPVLDGVTNCPQKLERPVSPLIRACPSWTVDLR
jgi:hypothetical protein